jgi:hypothetical protein
MAYTVIVAAVTPPVAPVAIHPVGAAPGGPLGNVWTTNPFVVSLTVAPPEIAAVPIGQLAVAVAGMKVVVPTGRVTGAAVITWAPSDFHETVATARLLAETAPAARAPLVTEPGASDALVTAPAASLLVVTAPLASLAVLTEFAASNVESIEFRASFRPVTDRFFRVLPLISVPASEVPPIAITSATSAMAVAVLGRGTRSPRVNDQLIVSSLRRLVVSSKDRCQLLPGGKR